MTTTSTVHLLVTLDSERSVVRVERIQQRLRVMKTSLLVESQDTKDVIRAIAAVVTELQGPR